MVETTPGLVPPITDFVERAKNAREADEQIEADRAYLADKYREAFGRQLATAQLSPAPEPQFRLTIAFLKFHEGLLVFSSAIIAAIFIGWPNSYNIVDYERAGTNAARGELTKVFGDNTAPDIYLHVLSFIVVTAILTAVAAFLSQVWQKHINKANWRNRTGLKSTGVVGLLTIVAIASGAWAGAPLVANAWCLLRSC